MMFLGLFPAKGGWNPFPADLYDLSHVTFCSEKSTGWLKFIRLMVLRVSYFVCFFSGELVFQTKVQ